VNLSNATPAAYKALLALSGQVVEQAGSAGLDPLLVGLVKIRTSQINGCAFCLQLHTRDALDLGEKTSGWPCSRRGGRPRSIPPWSAQPWRWRRPSR
jgi:AhpD family alkylhydroperoxidase